LVPPAVSVPPAKSTVTFELDGEQLARFEALVEALRKKGIKTGRADLLLAGLEALVQEETAVATEHEDHAAEHEDHGAEHEDYATEHGPEDRAAECGPENAATEPALENDKTTDSRSKPRVSEFTRVNSRARRPAGTRASGQEPARVRGSPYQVAVQLCPRCQSGAVSTNRGVRPIPGGVLRAILCDSQVLGGNHRNTSTVPPALRRRVLKRDGHRCRTQGCGNAHFLEVHHVVPRTAGGPHALDNLVTLCSACHRWLHRSS